MTDNQIGSERHRFCPSCGAEAVTGGSFCSECGRSLIKTPVPVGQGGLTGTQPTNVATASRPQVSGEVAPVRKSRKWLWPVGVAVVLLVAAGVILGVSSGNSGTTAPGESAADALGHQLYQENADVGLAENTCTTQADEQNAMTVTAFVNDCINAYVNGGGTTGSTGNTGNSGATGASGDSGTGGTGNTGNTATTTTPPTTTTTTVPLTSAQQAFANAVTSQLPLYVSSTNPPLTPSAIANVGSEICTAFSIGASQYASGGGGPAQDADSFVYQAMLPELANGAIEGGNGTVAVPRISGGGTDTLINLAIQNLCSQYSDGIPSG